mmetsp:Transcript_125663/g.222661  ORF Transcript_125663/g.222661 Transcript_125663/m.222661 type:complete len:508 (+) Transcript_125663:25-1548(+)
MAMTMVARILCCLACADSARKMPYIREPSQFLHTGHQNLSKASYPQAQSQEESGISNPFKTLGILLLAFNNLATWQFPRPCRLSLRRPSGSHARWHSAPLSRRLEDTVREAPIMMDHGSSIVDAATDPAPVAVMGGHENSGVEAPTDLSPVAVTGEHENYVVENPTKSSLVSVRSAQEDTAVNSVTDSSLVALMSEDEDSGVEAPTHSSMENGSQLSSSASRAPLSGPALSAERRLLRGVLGEALDKQTRKRFGLEQQKKVMLTDVPDASDNEAARMKKLRRAEVVEKELLQADVDEKRLLELKADLMDRKADLTEIRRAMEEELGLASRLQTFDVDKHAHSQWGRPDGFQGLVIESPKGLPILVARKSFKDSLLRRISQGRDLWFQVADGSGSRVLLRTSMHESLKRSPRECMEAAADLAAYFSTWRRTWAYYDPNNDPEELGPQVPVMYTDSQRVAARGSRMGQMKYKKRLGTIYADPRRVADLAFDAMMEQGWIDRVHGHPAAD